MIKRNLSVCKLKEEKRDYYIEMHGNIWVELVKEYHEGGIQEISCFLDGLMLYVYGESDDTKMPTGIVDKKWQALMADCVDPDYPRTNPVEVFRMKSGKI